MLSKTDEVSKMRKSSEICKISKDNDIKLETSDQ